MLKRLTTLFHLFSRKARLLFMRPERKSLLVIKVDVIGDFIIFNGFFRFLAASKKFEGYKITLVGNSLWKDLYEELNADLACNVIWVDRNAWMSSDSYKNDVVSSLTTRKYSDLVVFHCSRTEFTENLMMIASAANVIGITGNEQVFLGSFRKFVLDLFYSKFISIPDELAHEFDKYKYFTAQLTGENVPGTRPHIELKSGAQFPAKDRVVIAPGAGLSLRQLPTERLKFMVNLLVESGEKICFVGSKAEKPLVAELMQALPAHADAIDLTATFPLKDLPAALQSSKLVICNDSGVFHMAVALNKPVMVIAGGGHFARFVDYADRDKIVLCNHPMVCYNCNWNCIYKDSAWTTYPCISAIEEEQVRNSIRKVLAISHTPA